MAGKYQGYGKSYRQYERDSGPNPRVNGEGHMTTTDVGTTAAVPGDDGPTRWVLASFSAGAGLVHLVMAPSHLATSAVEGGGSWWRPGCSWRWRSPWWCGPAGRCW